jgi:hypothetical protein
MIWQKSFIFNATSQASPLLNVSRAKSRVRDVWLYAIHKNRKFTIPSFVSHLEANNLLIGLSLRHIEIAHLVIAVTLQPIELALGIFLLKSIIY